MIESVTVRITYWLQPPPETIIREEAIWPLFLALVPLVVIVIMGIEQWMGER